MSDPQEDHSMDTEEEGQLRNQSATGMSQSSAVGPPSATYCPQGAQVTQSHEPMELSVDEDLYTSGTGTQETPTTPVTQQPSRVSPLLSPLQQTFSETKGSTADTTGFTARPAAKDSQENPTTLKEPVQDTLKIEMQDPQTSTSSNAQDVAAVLVQIVWKVEPSLSLSKLEMMLQKGLQSVLNRSFKSVTIEKLFLDTPSKAKIIITPSKACDALLDMNSTQLKLKDDSEVDVYFKGKSPLEDMSAVAATLKPHESSIQKTQGAYIPDIPMTVSVEINVLKYGHELGKSLLEKFVQHTSGNTITFKGTFEEVDRFYQLFRQVVGSSVAMNANTLSEHTNPEQMMTNQESMRVPLFQYWYLNHMHRKEIESIEERHGVKIEADVSVTVKETHRSNSESVTDASQEFAHLFKQCALNITSSPVSSVIQSVKDIQSLDAKLMLSGSAQNWRLVGPRVEVAQAQKMQKEELNNDAERPGGESWDKAESKSFHKESRWDSPKSIEMNIKDPLLDNGICISKDHWEIMTNALKKQIKDIKNKYGVDFHENLTPSDVTVTAHSTGNQIVGLELNAMRALMSLYQKVVMTTMSCSLQNPAHKQAENVKEYLDELRKQNSSLVVGEGTATNGVWMMIGLPDHLRFAVREIEKKLNGSIFDKEHKDMMGYDRDVEFMRPFTDGPYWEGSKLNEGGWGKGAASGGVDNESINPSKAYWGFEMGAGGTSVVGEASSSFYAQDGHKTGGAGRKETNGFGNDKRGETEAGVKGGSHDDRTAQPVGAESDGAKEEDKCPICMDEFTNKEKLPCGHGFCKDCLRQCVESMGKKCPVCTKVYGKIEGNQPDGRMTTRTIGSSLPGFGRCGTIVIDYNIPSGTQTHKHPKPGRPFYGANRTAYLPDNKEGREVLALLRRAFDQRLIFTVGTSRTSGSDDCVTWNDVHHKTNTHGGPQSFGYPDDTYLQRVREELKAKGIE